MKTVLLGVAALAVVSAWSMPPSGASFRAVASPAKTGAKPKDKAPVTAIKPTPEPPTPANATTINNSWYTMQAGSTPWGYFHETIEQRDKRLFYRYSMVKVENGAVFRENIGAIAEADLTPVAFNLMKSGAGTTEIIDATYGATKNGGAFTIEVKGLKSGVVKRHVSRKTILDVFFPVWLRNNWSSFKPRQKGVISTFAEDGERGEFVPRNVQYEIGEVDAQLGCREIKVQVDIGKGAWCMTEQGVLLRLVMAAYGGTFRIERVSGETEAKAFLSGIIPKT